MEYDVRLRHAAIALGIMGIAAIALVSTVPGALRPKTGLPSEIEHVIAYAVVAFTLLLISKRHRLVTSILIAIAAGSEIAQIWIPARDAAILDFLAGGLGVAIAMVAIRAVVRTSIHR